jgi:hypothetical protein
MPQWVDLRVLARTTKRPATFEVVIDCDAEEQCAWTWIGKRNDKMFCLREELAWKIRTWVTDRCKTLAKAEQDDLMAIIDAQSFVDDLQLPVLLRKDTGTLESSGVGVMKTLNPFEVDSGTKALVVVFGMDADAQNLAA